MANDDVIEMGQLAKDAILRIWARRGLDMDLSGDDSDEVIRALDALCGEIRASRARVAALESVVGMDARDLRMVSYALWLQGRSLANAACGGFQKTSRWSIEDARKCMADGDRLLVISRMLSARSDAALSAEDGRAKGGE